MTNLKAFLILTISFTLCTFIFVFIVTRIYKFGRFWVDPEEKCKDFEKGISNFTIDVPLFKFWNNYVSFNDWEGSIQLKCPTVTHDIEIYLGGELVARTDTKYFDLWSQFDVIDCHGELIASSQSKSIFSFKNYFEFEVMDHQGELIGTFQRDDFITPVLSFFSLNGTKIAEAKRELISWTWKIQLLEHSSKISDLRILMGIIGKRGIFRNDDEGDVCNSMFAILLLLAVMLILFTFGFIMVNVYKAFIRNEDFFVFDIRV